MLLFAHTGITLGVFSLFYSISSKLSSYRKKVKFVASAKLSTLSPGAYANSDPPAKSKKWHIDYRFILLGSMFPDIVDKPLGMLIFAGSIANGRVYTHTLLINLILVLIGIYLLKRRGPNFLIFSGCSCFHLVLDEMWLTPKTLFWPLFGWRFPKENLSHWWENIFQALFTNPWVYVPEAIGATVIIIFGLILIKRRAIGKFLFQGSVE